MARFLVFLLLASPVPPARTGQHLHVEVSPQDLVLGPSSAPVTFIEFADFECPYSRRIEPLVEGLLKEYEGRIRFVHKDFPLDVHPNAFAIASAARCGADQHLFWDLRRAYLLAPASLDETLLKRFAEGVGLRAGPFAECLSARRYDPVVKESVEEALRYGFHTTPTFVINDTVVVGAVPLKTLRHFVDEALKGH